MMMGVAVMFVSNASEIFRTCRLLAGLMGSGTDVLSLIFCGKSGMRSRRPMD